MSDAIVIYTKPGCPFCAAAKEDLNSKGIEYTEHDVTADENAKEEA
ncbi:MAG: glutaredoxin, partial [Actinomycetota bacterium]